MNKTYAAQMLLAHGPLTRIEFTEITGWKKHHVERTLAELVKQKQLTKIQRSHYKRPLYALASSPTAAPCTHLTAPTQIGHSTTTPACCRG